MRIRASYSPAYAPTIEPTLARFASATAELVRLGFVEIEAPPPFDPSVLRGLHSRAYLEAFHRGQEPLASSQGIPWSTEVRDATYAMLAGQLASVSNAIRDGVALNVARGFHHATRWRGAGYCAINGLALVAHAWPALRVFVIDCDEHGGNGTEEYAAELPNLYCASIFGTRFGCYGGRRSWAFPVSDVRSDFAPYARALETVSALVANIRPDVILYQAGVDCHVDDPKSRARLTDDQLQRRDEYVFALARVARTPIQFNFAGGYQPAATLARLNADSVRVALRVFGGATPSA